MTNRLCVLSAEAVCESLSEGTEDYCIIVCDKCMNIDLRANPASTLSVRPGGSKFASKDFTGELYLGIPIYALQVDS